MIPDVNRIFGVSEAMRVLRPNCHFIIENEVLEWLDENQEAPTEAEIQAEIQRQQAEYDAKKYQEQRVKDYPSIGDQLDALFHAGVFPEEMATQLQAVKDAHPKPTTEGA